jgi:hypothetical protein
LAFAGQWLGTAVGTTTGRVALFAGVVGLVVLLPFLFPSWFPSTLRSRGQKAAYAWLAKDAAKLKEFAEPSVAEMVPRWLEENPPPDLSGQKPPATVTVGVERNDGRSAEILIQIKTRKDDRPTFLIYRHRWVSRNGTWYIRPTLSPSGVALDTHGRS